jgi:hypothetical protein
MRRRAPVLEAPMIPRLSPASRHPRLRLACALLLAAGALGCSSGGGGDNDGGGGSGGGGGALPDKCKQGTGGTVVDKSATLTVENQASGQSLSSGDTISVSAAGVAEGTTLDTVLVLENTQNLDTAQELLIRSVNLVGDENFSCLARLPGAAEVPCADVASVASVVPNGFDPDCVTQEAATAIELVIRFTKPADNGEHKVLVLVDVINDDRHDSAATGDPFEVSVSTQAGVPAIAVAPSSIDFGTVKLDSNAKEKFIITNTGNGDLVIEGLKLSTQGASAPWTAELDGKTYGVSASTHVLDPPLVIAPQKQAQGFVTFAAADSFGQIATLEVVPAEPLDPQKINLAANQNVACLKVTPVSEVNFGFVGIAETRTREVTLSNCGAADVEVSSFALSGDDDGVFTVDFSAIGDGTAPSEETPVVLQANGKVTVPIDCLPQAEESYTADVGIADNTAEPNKSLKLTCIGSNQKCPTPLVSVSPGEETIPQSELTLDGSQSFASSGQQIVSYKWKLIKAPEGAVDHTFWPNDESAVVQFGAKTTQQDFAGNPIEVVTVNIAGEYVFELDVVDDSGASACLTATTTVLVIPDEDIHVQLLWDTPNDPDKTDQGLGAGADMDLHFAHSTALLEDVCQDPPKMCGNKPCVCQPDLNNDGSADPWFHEFYDVWFQNKQPNWGNIDTGINDNPRLDLDDTDGWGPENINLKLAENGATYHVGVHYWDAFDFGDSKATVRIYILGALKSEDKGVQLSECDLWWVKKIAWPSGDILEYDKPGEITADYAVAKLAALGGKCK